MRISDWSPDVCSSDLLLGEAELALGLFLLLALGQVDLLLAALLFLLALALLGGDRVAVDLLLLDRRRLGHEVLGFLLLGHRRFLRRGDRKSTRLTSSPYCASCMPSSDCNKTLPHTLHIIH